MHNYNIIKLDFTRFSYLKFIAGEHVLQIKKNLPRIIWSTLISTTLCLYLHQFEIYHLAIGLNQSQLQYKHTS